MIEHYAWQATEKSEDVRPPRWLWSKVERRGHTWAQRNLCHLCLVLNIPYYVTQDMKRKWKRTPPDEYWVAFSSLVVRR